MANEPEPDRDPSDAEAGPDDSTRDWSPRERTGRRDSASTAPEIRFEPSRRPDSLGRIGSYEILEYLGRGGMGMVWKATDVSLGRPVALKLMAPELREEESARQRFLREARAAAAVKHPNVVTVHAVSEHCGMPYLAMEFVEGGTLKDRLDASAPLAIDEAVEAAFQVAQGLAAIHERGVVHRDVKPSNVLVEKNSRETYKIGDFGLARIGEERSDLSMTGATFGTTAYMSPEQLLGEPLDRRSDLFSLGSLLYEAIAGEAPFRGPTAAATGHHVITAAHRPLCEIRPDVPSGLSQVVDKLLAKDRKDRYGSAGEAAEALNAVLASLLRPEAAPADPTRAGTVSYRFVGRRIAGVAVACVLLASLGVWWFAAPASSDSPSDSVRITLSEMADGRDFEQALAAVPPGGTIVFAEAGEYPLNLVLEDAERWNGVTLSSSAENVILRPLDPTKPIVDLVGVRGVTVEGLELETNGDSHAIRMTGCEGIKLRKLQIRQTATRNKAAIQIIDCNSAPEAEPLQIVDCEVTTQTDGQCLWLQNETRPVWNVSIERNQFVGNERGTLVALVFMPGKIEVRQNRFASAHVGLNMNSLPGGTGTRSDQTVVADNVFESCNAWIGLWGTDPARTPFSMVENVIRDCNAIEATPEQLGAVEEHCDLRGNRWERRSAEGPLPQALQDLFDVVEVKP